MTSSLTSIPETSRSSNAVAEQSNGAASPAPVTSAISRSKRRRRSRLWAVGIVLCVAATGVGAAWLLIPASKNHHYVIWSPARISDVQLTVTERGELDSANNVDITCDVKIGKTTRGPTIRWLIDPGTVVRKGDVLVKLEDSAFQKDLLDQEIVLKKAKNEYQQAEDHLEIVNSQNKADLRVAELNVETSEIDLERYTKGEYLKKLKEVESRRLLSKSDVERWEQRVGFVRQMVAKKSYSTAQLEAELKSLQSAQVALSTIEEEIRVLTTYDDKLSRKQFESAVAQAKSNLARIRIQAKAQENQAVNDRDTKEAVYRQELAKYNEIKAEIEKCVIHAPKEGLVVYYESARSKRSSESEKIEIGSTVYEGQKLLQIPDLQNMLVITRVHEALISNVRGEKHQRTGFGEGLQLALLANPSPGARLFGLMSYSALRQSPDSAWINELDQVKTFDGQRADVMIDALPGQVFPGRVKSVSTVATKAWYSEVRTYETVIEITGDVRGFKPGMSARVQIYTDRRADNVLSIPVQSVFRQFANNRMQHFAYVKGPEGPELRPIEVGISNDRIVEVKKGLAIGEMIAENPMDIHNESNGELALPGKGGGAKNDPRKGQGKAGK